MAGGRDMDIEINKTIHERARLMILTYVATREETPVPFNEIKSALNMTGGNLSVQLRNLEEAGYVEVCDMLPPPVEAGASWDVSANADIITRLSPFVQWFYMFHFFYSKNTATLSFDIDCCVYIALQHCSAFFTTPYPIR